MPSIRIIIPSNIAELSFSQSTNSLESSYINCIYIKLEFSDEAVF